MEKEFIPYQTALELKELGFNQPCFGWWFADEEMLIIDKSTKSTSENIIQAPTFSQAFRWFREKFGYYADLFVDDDKTFGFMISSFVKEGVLEKPIQRNYSSYEETELACLIKLIEIVKNSK